MKRKLALVALLVLALLVVTGPAALAQSGGGRFIVGGSFVLKPGETQNTDLFALGSEVNLQGDSAVNGNVSLMGGSLVLAGTVHGDVTMFGGKVTLTDTAVLQGNLRLVGGTLERAAGAQVSGEVNRAEPPANVAPAVVPRTAPLSVPRPLSTLAHWLLALMWATLATVLAGLLLLAMPAYSARMLSAVGQQPAYNFVAGLLSIVLALLVGIPLLIVCGLGLVVWLAAAAVLAVGWVIGSIWLGRRILAATHVRDLAPLAEAGLAVFSLTWLATSLPSCLTFMVVGGLGSLGAGAVVLTRLGSKPLTIGTTRQSFPPE